MPLWRNDHAARRPRRRRSKQATILPRPAKANGFVALPALANPHDHGRGLRHIAVGASDQRFELWRPALYAMPPLDPYLKLCGCIRPAGPGGVGSIVEVYSSIRTDRLLDDAIAICRAARDVGVRLSFVVPMRDQMTLGYAPDDDLLRRHDPRDHDIIRKTWLYPFPPPAEYMDVAKAVAAACEGPMVTIQYGPNSPYACSDALLERLAAASAGDGRRIQTHLLETHAQREWADATYKAASCDISTSVDCCRRASRARTASGCSPRIAICSPNAAPRSRSTPARTCGCARASRRSASSSSPGSISALRSIRSRSTTMTTRFASCASPIGCTR